MEPSIWTRSVPLIQDGQPVDATHTNPPNQVLAERTDALKTILDALEAGQQIVLRDVSLASGVQEGHVVYLDPDTLKYDKAQALYDSLNSQNGRLFPANEALFSGVVISKSSSSVGTILLSGYGTIDSAAISRLFGTATPAYGLYYLSALTPGTVTTTAPDMATRVLQYTSDGLLRVLQMDFEPETHTHRQYDLFVDTWDAVASFDSDIVPDGATYGYDFSATSSQDQLLGEVLLPAVGEGMFVWKYEVDGATGGTSSDKGKHIEEELILLDGNGIWWFDSSAPDQDIQLTITVADTKGASLINTIASNTPNALDVDVTNGRAFLTVAEYTETPDQTGNTVVKGVNVAERKLLTGPVVERIVPGTGMSVSPTSGKGTVTVQTTGFANFSIAADLVNLDNALTRSDDPLVFIDFPVDRESKAYMQVVVPYLASPGDFEIVIWARFKGCNTSAVSNMYIDAAALPKPDASGVAIDTPAGFPVNLDTIPVDTKYYEFVASETIDATDYSQGEIYYNVYTDGTPDDTVRMLSTGIRIQAK